MKKAIVVGHTGQDGTYLSKLLYEKNYEVIGISSKKVSQNKYGISKVDICDKEDVENLIHTINPHEVYFFAVVHQSSSDSKIEDGELFQKSLDINVKAFVNFLEAIRKFSSQTKIFYAASSHIFGSPMISPQNELTPLKPDCIYGITKTTGVEICHFYKNNHIIFACVGVFYNHESPLREAKYVSKKIVETAVAIKYGLKKELILGSLESEIDWGYAPDYMNAVYKIMQLDKPEDFIISSGNLHTIKDFVSGVFTYLGMEWEKLVKINPELITKKQKRNLFGDNQKIKKLTDWSPTVSFKELIAILVDAEVRKYATK